MAGVVVLHQMFGLTDDTRRQADRLAAAGYLALAPDLFSRGGALRCLRTTFRALLTGKGVTFDDIEASRTLLVSRPDCTGSVGVIGFCMGGGVALLAATRGFQVSDPNYGALPRDPEQVLRGARPIIASYGGRDRALPGSRHPARTSLDRPGHRARHQGVRGRWPLLHETAPRPLTVLENVLGVGNHQRSAEDAWPRILGFFAQHLAGPE